MGAVSAVIALQFIRYISTPFEKWKAYELGLIDETGKKIRDAETSEEKKEFEAWKNIIRKLKMAIEKLSGGARLAKIASFATALWLLKEEADKRNEDGSKIINNLIEEHIDATLFLIEDRAPKVLTPGVYTTSSEYIDEKTCFMVKSYLEPHTMFLGTNMYKLKNVVSEKIYIIAEDDLQELK